MQSDEELKRDHLDLMSFINQDNIVKRDKERKEKQLLDKRQEKEENLKRLNREIQQVRSDIEKNKDFLKGLAGLQQFILDLSPEDFKEKRDMVQQEILVSAKQEWIQRHKRDTTQDYVIGFYGTDEEIHEGTVFEKSADEEKTVGFAGAQQPQGKA